MPRGPPRVDDSLHHLIQHSVLGQRILLVEHTKSQGCKLRVGEGVFLEALGPDDSVFVVQLCNQCNDFRDLRIGESFHTLTSKVSEVLVQVSSKFDL